MQINEIQPSTFKDVKNIAQSANNTTPGDDIIGRKLEANGFEFVRQGGFADVYETPDQTAIVKYNRLADPCYEKFMAYILNDPKNPALPRITKPFNFDFEGGKSGFVVVMEKLQPLSLALTPAQFYALRLFLRYQQNKLSSRTRPASLELSKEGLNTLDSGQKAFIYKFAKKHVNAIKEYFKIVSALSECEVDIHTGNFMIRPSTGDLVIIDPVSSLKD